MREILLATDNKNKIEELQKLLEGEFIVRSKKDFGLETIEVEETGESLEENARLKIEKMLEYGNFDPSLILLADDTGLFVEKLEGRPGVYSARFAGEKASYEDNVAKLLDLLEGQESPAYFETVICLYQNQEYHLVHGRLHGKIIPERRGNKGFGYDPVFYLEDKKKTLAELSMGEKNQLSHRAIAYRNLKKHILLQ